VSERTSALAGATGSGPTMRPRTTAQGVVGSLVLPPARPAPSQPASPLPLTELHRLPRDASLLYDIGRVDGSGRIASNDIVSALNWSPSSRMGRAVECYISSCNCREEKLAVRSVHESANTGAGLEFEPGQMRKVNQTTDEGLRRTAIPHSAGAKRLAGTPHGHG
jgi:hypothetical protein